MSDFDIARVSLSLPCMVPVLPGTPKTDAPIEQRTETCNLDAWWVMGIAFICDVHLREFLGEEDFDRIRDGCEGDGWDMARSRERDAIPWADQHRYEQKPELLPEGHPVRRMAGV